MLVNMNDTKYFYIQINANLHIITRHTLCYAKNCAKKINYITSSEFQTANHNNAYKCIHTST